MSWVDGPLLGLDLETDSPDPDDAHLITAAIMHYRPGHELTRMSWVAKPTRPIPEEAARIHGYPTERAESEGKNPAAVVMDIAEVLDDLWSTDCPLICCNSPFDLTVIDRELRRHHSEGAGYEIDGLPPVVDIYLIDRVADPWRPGKRTLTDLSRHYGVPLDAAHDASADIHATMRIAYLQGRRHRSANPWPIGATGTPMYEELEAWRVLSSGCPKALNAAERRWYTTWSRGLAKHFRSPKALENIERDHAAGLTIREQADELIRTLPARADDVERNADGWPMRRR